MTYREAHEIIEEHRSVYNQYGENTVQRMIYQGRDYKNAAFQYFREWDDEISTEDIAVLKRIYSYL